MKLRIAISPCPNDTFIFDALYSGMIDSSPLEFEFILEDIETLNHLAEQQAAEIIKLSYANYFRVMEHYIMLPAGSALGHGVGPLLISKNDLTDDQLAAAVIAIPGRHTTANFLMSYAYPGITNKEEVVFSQIEDMVLSGHAGAGVIIHENRFTYREKGLKCLLDLGEYWERKTGCPIPLGGIAIRRDLANDIKEKVNHLIRASLTNARTTYPSLSTFVTSNAQAMHEDTMRRHIDLYVNDYSFDVGESGRNAVAKMAECLEIKPSNPLFFEAHGDSI